MQRIILEMRFPAVVSVLAVALACSEGAPPPRTTIQGQVIAVDGRPAAGLDARMAGTALVAATDAGGRFSLSGAPSGPSVLQFGRGNASVELPPVSDGMVVNVSVRLSADGSAALQGEPQVMLRRKIPSVAGSGLRIGGTIITTDAGTALL